MTALVYLSGKLDKTMEDLNHSAIRDGGFLAKAGIHRLSTYPTGTVGQLLKTYRKFLFVRDPFERLVSAYRHKFTRYNNFTEFFQHTYGREMIRRYRMNPSEKSLHDAKDVKFEEFLMYLTDTSIPNRLANSHWAPYNTLCHPCEVDYDYVGKIETMDEDNEMIIKLLFNQTTSSRGFQFPMQKSNGNITVTRTHLANISAELRNALWKTYGVDFRLFGYWGRF